MSMPTVSVVVVVDSLIFGYLSLCTVRLAENNCPAAAVLFHMKCFYNLALVETTVL